MTTMAVPVPRLCVAGLSGDSGKTVVSLALLTALRLRGQAVSVFKKGPDYIDPAWLTFAAGSTCRNLDTYMVPPEAVYARFVQQAADSDIAVIEGNRGLFDGLDARGTHSTAALARLLCTPVVLVVSAVKATRTIAAQVLGCQKFDPELQIAGVIVNKVAGPRHEEIIRASLAEYCDLPVLGAIPRLEAELIPSRHLGLVTPAEFGPEGDLEARLLQIATEYLDVDRLIEIAAGASSLDVPEVPSVTVAPARVRVGYFRDEVFTFYYPENLEALHRLGAELVPVSALANTFLPEIDALYIGGGFPETHADALAGNRQLLNSVREAAGRGLPIYAECGGLIFLSRSLTWEGTRYPMAGVFPHDLAMHARPRGHGYTEVTVDSYNPFFAVGETIRGHEFHYSALTDTVTDLTTCMHVERGTGLGGGRDGLVFKNTLACYTHIHADGVATWAKALVERAQNHGRSASANPTQLATVII
jgi:cobyrinic acid a,c-diamide synthase